MTSTETIGTRRTKKIAEEAGKQAAREAVMEMNFGSDNDESEAASVEGSTAAVGEKRDPGFDIFDNVGHPMSQQGVTVRYTIRKNNELAGVKKHPYSWIKVAQDFGPGDYQIIAKDPNKKYLSSQNLTISEYNEVFKHMIDESDDDTPTPAVQFQQPNLGFLEMFNLIQSQSDRARSEASQTATQQAQTQVAMITAMTEMMKNQQLQGQTLFMEMTKMTAQVAKEMAATQEKLMEKMNQRMDKIAELTTKKPEGPSWLEIMKMQNEAQNKGFDLFEKITKLSELKAEEKLELIEEGRGAVGEARPKSMTDTLIESLLPVITASMLQNQQATQLALAQAQAGKRQALPQPRRPVQQGGAKQTPQRVVPKNNARPNSSAGTAQAHGPQKAQNGGKENSGVIKDSGQNVRQLIVTPPDHVETEVVAQSPVIDPTVVETAGETKVGESVADKVQVINTLPPEQVKERCMELLPTYLGTLMIDQVPPREGAKQTLVFLKDQGISRKQFLKNVALQEMIDFAKQFDLPTEAHDWLNEWYANIQNKPRNDARTEHATGSEHATT